MKFFVQKIYVRRDEETRKRERERERERDEYRLGIQDTQGEESEW